MLRHPFRRTLGTSLAICSLIAVAGCSDSDGGSAPTSAPDSTQAAATYDLSQLSQLEDDMPPGFVPYPSELRKTQHALVAGVGSVVANGKPFTVDPAGCSIFLKPVDGEAGADVNGFRADGQAKRSISVAAEMPVAVRGKLPETGCDTMTYSVTDERYPHSGTVERLAPPTIEGATVFAVKLTVDGFPDPEYYYAAILDDRLLVNVQARLAPDFQAEPVLPDLLVEAVAAIRGS